MAVRQQRGKRVRGEPTERGRLIGDLGVSSTNEALLARAGFGEAERVGWMKKVVAVAEACTEAVSKRVFCDKRGELIESEAEPDHEVRRKGAELLLEVAGWRRNEVPVVAPVQVNVILPDFSSQGTRQTVVVNKKG